MLERDLQAYLFENPQVLFPGRSVTSRRREVAVDRRRVDLLFVVDGEEWIIELKAVPITRDHVGQIAEYYGLLKIQNPLNRYRMMLVATSIPPWRSAYLEEMNIVCVEVPSIPHDSAGVETSVIDALKSHHKGEETAALDKLAMSYDGFQRADVGAALSDRTVALTRRIVHDLLPHVSRLFPTLDVVPIRVGRRSSNDVDVTLDGDATQTFKRGAAWFGFKVGVGHEGPKNNVPNISAIFYPHGLDVTINAELLPSQRHFLSRIRNGPRAFDALLASRPDVALQTYLKLEHQPRAYHWLPLDRVQHPNVTATRVADVDRTRNEKHPAATGLWCRQVADASPYLTPGTRAHLLAGDRSLNLAWRLAITTPPEHPVWEENHTAQLEHVATQMTTLGPVLAWMLDGSHVS